MPQVQYIDKVEDVPVVKQRKVPMIQEVPKTVEVPQLQVIDKVVDMPVVKQRQSTHGPMYDHHRANHECNPNLK